MGVVFGGWLVDRMGGYKDESGEAVCTALKVCSWFGVGALAAAIPAALDAGRAGASSGADTARVAARDVLETAGMDIHYVEVTDPDLGPAPAQGHARLLVAVTVGGTRLIDNCSLDIGVGG